MHKRRPPFRFGHWLAITVLTAAPALSACNSRSEAEIRIVPAERHQTITGWEVTAEMADKPEPGPRPRHWQEIYDRAVVEIGINRLRVEVRSGAESASRNWDRYAAGDMSYPNWRAIRYATVNDNADPNVIDWNGFDFSELDWRIEVGVLPVRERLVARGENLFINLCYVAFTEQAQNAAYIHSDPEEYAEFVLATYLHLQRKFGFVPDAWEVILEPDNTQHWRGRPIGRAIAAAAARLKRHGFTPRFIAPSVTDMANAAAYIDGIAAVKGAMDHIVEFSYHRYRNGTAGNLAAIVERARTFGVNTAMLEWWFGRAGPETLHTDLKQGRVSAWQGRVLKGLFEIDDKRPDGPAVSLRWDTRMNLQYFRHVRAGARRIGATSSNEGDFDPLAFVNPDGRHTLVVLARSGGKVTVNGLPAGVYRVSYALEEKSGALPEPIRIGAAAPLRAEMPAPGVLTVYSENAPR